MKVLSLVLALGITTTSFASALIKKNATDNTLTVMARMVYSGDALTNDLAKASTDEIQRMWSENLTNVTLEGVSYKVIFAVDYVLAGEPLKNDSSCAYNFIQILNKTDPGDRSYYAGLGSRSGVFYTSDNLGSSTTAPHEFGHGLYLDHNDSDQLAAEVPGIMFARGTLVRPQFQWNPNALPGAAGGTINPIYRHVRSDDILAVPFGLVKFNSDDIGCLGDGVDLDIL